MPRGIYEHKKKSENKDQSEAALDPTGTEIRFPNVAPINDNDGEMFSSLDHLIGIAKMKAREMDLIVEELEVLRSRFKGKG